MGSKYELPLVELSPIEDFCSQNPCCPPNMLSPTYPSPTSCLPIEKLKDVEDEIAAANELLLDLALNERSSQEIYRNAFRGLEGLYVEVTLNTNNKVEGHVQIAGFDFVVLLNEKQEVIIPYSVIDEVKLCGRYAVPIHEASLRDVDPCFRREVAYHFGEVVSSSPELLHLFFGMRLPIYLLSLEAKRIELTFDGIELKGFVTDVNKDSIVLKIEKELRIIPLAKLTLIKKMKESIS